MLLFGQQEGHPACKKTERWGAGMVFCLERGAVAEAWSNSFSCLCDFVFVHTLKGKQLDLSKSVAGPPHALILRSKGQSSNPNITPELGLGTGMEMWTGMGLHVDMTGHLSNLQRIFYIAVG